MKRYKWNEDKNEWLKRVRRISFEEILFHISEGDLLDVLEHPNQGRYPNQKIFVVDVEGYAVIVPFVEDEEVIFMKTIIPSRKLTKRYLAGKQK
ncbi:MAG: hypothetical protein WBW88_15940 [Rhodothermales bacterium]